MLNILRTDPTVSARVTTMLALTAAPVPDANAVTATIHAGTRARRTTAARSDDSSSGSRSSRSRSDQGRGRNNQPPLDLHPTNFLQSEQEIVPRRPSSRKLRSTLTKFRARALKLRASSPRIMAYPNLGACLQSPKLRAPAELSRSKARKLWPRNGHREMGV